MTVAEMFEKLLENLAIDNQAQISHRYGELTACLNKKFRDTESKTANTLQVGSYGRRTAVKGISDLDMLYVMPASNWDDYKEGNQLKLLQDVKAAIDARYPATTTRVDRQVVVVSYVNFEVEVVPSFEQDDGSFKFPDTYDGGSWPITKPREEKAALSEMDEEKNFNLKKLCKMVRAWKNKNGIVMGGLLIDTLAYNFLKSTDEYDTRSYLYFDFMSRDFFLYLSEQPDQEFYRAPGSRQEVTVKKKFQKKAQKAHQLCLEAIKAEGKNSAHKKWKKVFGVPFPAKPTETSETLAKAYDDTEEWIENIYYVDIKYSLRIDCEVSQNAFREFNLRELLRRGLRLLPKKKLLFKITDIDVPTPFDIKWKVLNQGDEAKRRNNMRGEISDDGGDYSKEETTLFRGEHVVECFAIQKNIVVARARIDVPIE